jgi:hypothetical protein
LSIAREQFSELRQYPRERRQNTPLEQRSLLSQSVKYYFHKSFGNRRPTSTAVRWLVPELFLAASHADAATACRSPRHRLFRLRSKIPKQLRMRGIVDARYEREPLGAAAGVPLRLRVLRSLALAGRLVSLPGTAASAVNVAIHRLLSFSSTAAHQPFPTSGPRRVLSQARAKCQSALASPLPPRRRCPLRPRPQNFQCSKSPDSCNNPMSFSPTICSSRYSAIRRPFGTRSERWS